MSIECVINQLFFGRPQLDLLQQQKRLLVHRNDRETAKKKMKCAHGKANHVHSISIRALIIDMWRRQLGIKYASECGNHDRPREIGKTRQILLGCCSGRVDKVRVRAWWK